MQNQQLKKFNPLGLESDEVVISSRQYAELLCHFTDKLFGEDSESSIKFSV